MSGEKASRGSSRLANWRAFASRDWGAMEAETRQARRVAYRKAGPEVHHALYLELSEAVLARQGRQPPRDRHGREEDRRTHEHLQEAFRRLAKR